MRRNLDLGSAQLTTAQAAAPYAGHGGSPGGGQRTGAQ